MKRVYMLLLCVLGAFSLALGQTRDLKEYFTSPPQPIQGHLYIKDISGTLKPFIGYWVGTFKSYTYEFFIRMEERDKRGWGDMDALYAHFNVYQRNKQGELRLIQSSLTNVEGVSTRPDDMMGLAYTKGKPSYYFWYDSEIEGKNGNVYLYPQADGRLMMYQTDDPTFRSTSGEQVFPFCDFVGEGTRNEHTFLTKRSDDPTIPSMRTLYGGSYKNSLLSEIIDLQRMYGSKGYFNCFDSWMLDRVYLEDEKITQIPPHKRPWAEYGQVVARKHRDAEVFGRNRVVNYELYFAEGFEHQSRLVRASRYFCLLVQCTMIEEMVKDLDEKGELGVLDHLIRTNFDSFDSSEPFTRYAELKGTTIAKLKEHYMQDGLKLLKLLFPKTSEAELRTALSNAIIDVRD